MPETLGFTLNHQDEIPWKMLSLLLGSKKMFIGDVLPRAGETSREITTFGKFNPKSLPLLKFPLERL